MMPSTLDPPISGWFFQITPMGAPRFVTNEIMAYRNIIVIMAMILPFVF
jgi:hypothetical protein